MSRNSSLILPVLFTLTVLHETADADILGTAESFAVLAGSTVTNTNPSIISGNLGVWPGSAVTGFPPGVVVNGTIHASDAVAMQAQTDTTTAYNTLAGMAPTQDLTGQDLGGMTLTPGVYHFATSAQLTGTLTLNTLGNPNSLFVFQIGSTLTTASNSLVTTINGPNDCQVYWQIGSSATLGTGTTFLGNIVALTTITLTSGVNIVAGRALARNGAVSLDNVQVTAECTCILLPTSVDCNDNDVPDECDISNGTTPDCNANGVPDGCDIANGTSTDCDQNGVPDDCQTLTDCDGNGVPDVCNTSPDCNANGIPDSCDIANGTPDCNSNGIPDSCDITNGAPDCNGNGIPDSCDITNGLPDCNGNGVPDVCDITSGTSGDCDLNGVPDSCQPDCNGDGTPNVCEVDCNANGTADECEGLADCDADGVPDVCENAPDCNSNGIPDVCDISNGTTPDCDQNGVPDVCQPDCNGDGTPNVCETDCNQNGTPDECETLTDCDKDGIPDVCEANTDCNDNGVPDECEGLSDCDSDGTPDVCEVSTDCNDNGMPDNCDIANGTPDCNGNGIPDICDITNGTLPDCNGNGVPDICDISNGLPDCNGNGIPDICDITNGMPDCNNNGMPDICETPTGLPDCDGNGVPDLCDITSGDMPDCDNNGIPDLCDITSGDVPDCNNNGRPDICDITNGTATDCDHNGIPDVCDLANGAPDCNGNGVSDACDVGNGTSEDCNRNGVPDSCDGGCLADCQEFDRTVSLTASDTLTLLTAIHNPQSDQGYVYVFAVDNLNRPIDFDALIGQMLIFNAMDAFVYSINAVDYRALVAPGGLTDLDNDGIRDLNGLEYERTAGELQVPVFIGQTNPLYSSQLILIGLSGGALFDTTVNFRIFNDNEQAFSANHTFRCWEKIDVLDISGAFRNSFLANSSNDDPGESLGTFETGWFRMSGGTASSTAFSIQNSAIYGVYVERIRPYVMTAELPFEECTQSAHLLPLSVFGDNQELATGGASDRNCATNIARRRPGSLLLYPEFDNRTGVTSVLTLTNTNASSAVRVHMIYIGR